MPLRYVVPSAPSETPIGSALRRVCFPLDCKLPPALQSLLRRIEG